MDAVFHSILEAAAQAGASDVHLKQDGPVIFRINRQLIPVEAPKPTEAWMREVLGEIVPEHLRPILAQEHEIDFAFAREGLGRFRVNVFQQRGQLTFALRLVKMSVPTLQALNLAPITARIAEAPRGIIIIAGAIGSGKSTTLAAMIEHLNGCSRRHIITLEDPIEYLFEDNLSVIQQREIGIDTQSFTSGLRNVLRQDPDVLVIGEMRDAESAAAAMSAANIGHLVITTLHTSDAAKSIQRILDLFPASERDYARRLFADTLHAVICQRLIHSSKAGIVPALEILLNNAGVAKLISNDRFDQIPAEIEMGSNDGMQTFDTALQQLVSQGRITREEALAHAGNADSLRMLFKGVVLNDSRRILGAR